MKRWTYGLINRLAVGIDFIMLSAGLLAAHMLWGEGELSRVLLLCLLQGGLYSQIMHFGEAYRVEHYQTPGVQLRQVSVALPLAAIAVALVEAGLLGGNPPYGVDLPLTLILPYIAVLIGRFTIVMSGTRYLLRKNVLQRRAIIVGAADEARALLAKFGKDGPPSLRIVAIFTDIPPGAVQEGIENIPVLGMNEDMAVFARDHDIDVAMIACSWDDLRTAGASLDRLGRIALDVVMPLSHPDFQLRFAQVTHIGAVPMLQVARQPLKGSRVIVKQLEDYVVALIGIIITSPVLLLSCLAVKLESPGPVIFRQQRTGYNSKPFTLYKLRTMRIDPADDGSHGTVRDDPRITRVGAILRKLSIDELPQLFNVLGGSMSVVGPRPHVPHMKVGEGREYDTVGAYMHRYRMKPGITGWAQINGMRGGIRSLEKAERGVQLDLYYVENWSLWLDIKIMLLTITRGLAGRNVY